MKKLILFVTAVSTFISLAVPSLWAQNAAQKVPATASEAAAKAKPTKHHTAAASMETLSGTISMVDTGKRVVVVTDSNGIPFDLKVTGATHIMVSGKRAKLSDLSDATSKQASVKYRAEKQAGDIATSIEVGS